MARSFNGTSQGLQSSAAVSGINGKATCSISFWLIWNAFANNDELLLESSANYNNSNGTLLIDPNESATAGFAFITHNAGGYNKVHFARPSAGVWHHYLLVFDSNSANNMLAWVDGVAQTLTIDLNQVAGASFGSFVFNLMCRNQATLFGAGTLAEFAVFSEGLDQAAATALANGSSPFRVRPGSLVLYYPLHGVGSPEPDYTSGSNNATLTNAPTAANHAPVGPPAPPIIGFSPKGIVNTDKTHNIDAFVAGFSSPSHNIDADVQVDQSKSHNIDALVTVQSGPNTHSIDAFVTVFNVSYLKLAGNIIFPINPSNGFVRIAGTIAAPQLSYVQLLATIKAQSLVFVNLAGNIQSSTRAFVKLTGTISGDKTPTHNIDAVVSTPALSFVNLNATIQTKIATGPCGSFPDASFVKLAGWIVSQNDSIQAPNSGFSSIDDFLSSQIALSSYKPISVISLAGINLIITAFTAGVISWQTRTRSWLRRIDEAPGGILLTTEVNTHTLPNGAVITTTTTREQFKDTLITTVVIQNSATPQRTSTVVTEKTKGGQTTTRETETTNINGIINKQVKKTVFSEPPTNDNIQPIRVRTLDGVEHFQFFDQVNPEWAGGEAEGVTTTNTKEQIIPGILNGQTQDAFGNPILTKVTNEVVQKPTGELIETHTEETGTRRDVGSITTDVTEQFNGIITITHKVTRFPDGSTEVVDITKNNITGDSTETTTEVVIDEFGQVTTTVTVIETKTFLDPTTNLLRTTETKTVKVTKSGVTTTDTTVLTTNDFEDDIVNDKIKVIFIQEFTITAVLDWQSLGALEEINISHQKNFALLELFGQMLGNATLSYALRQRLISQYNTANACVAPVPLQANGKLYEVVFAPSASALRAKYIPGTEPHVYEVQFILQQRSDLITGTRQFG